MSKVEREEGEVQDGMQGEREGQEQRVDASGGVFSDHAPGGGTWVMENDPDEFVEEGRQRRQELAQGGRKGAGGQGGQGQGGQGQGGQGQGGQGSEYQVTTKAGLVFRGKDADEVLQRALDAIDRQTMSVVQHRSEIANLRRQLGPERAIDGNGYAVKPGQTQGRRQEEETGAGAWDDKTFYETFAKDPRAAMAAAIQDYFGIQDPREALSHSFEISTKVRDRIEIADFLAQNPDFPQTIEASKIVLARLDEDGAELTSWNMKVAFDKLVNEGLVSRIEQQRVEQGREQEYEDQERQRERGREERPAIVTRSRGAGSPPAPRDSASSTTGRGEAAPSLEEFESWDYRKQQAYLKRIGMYHG